MRFHLLTILVAGALVVSAALEARARNTDRSADELLAAVDSLKTEARWGEALSAARALLELRKTEEQPRSYLVEDAARLIRTLESIESLPTLAQTELAGAYGMTEEYGRLYDAGAVDSAIAVVGEQTGVLERHLGHDHPDVARAKSDLGYLLHERGDFEEVEALYREALEIDRKTLGYLHPDVASDLNNLASFFRDTGDLAMADSLYRESLRVRVDVVGENDEGVAMLYGNLAGLFMDRGRYAEAEPLYGKSLAIYRTLHGSSDQDVADALHNLAILLIAKGDYAAAEPLVGEALGIYRGLKSNLDIALTLNTAASLLQDRGDYPAAEPRYREALRILRESVDPKHPHVAALLNNLGDLCHDEGDYARADSLYREALDIRRSIYGEENVEVAIILLNIARNYRDWEKYADAEPLYADALRMFRADLGNDHPHVAMCLYSMTSLFEAQGEYEKSAPLLLEAVNAYEASRYRVGPGLQRVMFQKSPYPKLANVCLRTGKAAEAWPAAERDLGRGLAELLFAVEKRSLTPAETQVEDSLKTTIADLEQELAVYHRAAQTDTAAAILRAEETRNRLLAAQAVWSGFQQEVMNKYSLTEGLSYPLDRVQAAIPRGTILVGWLDVEEKKGQFACWVYAIRDRGPVAWAPLRTASSGTSLSPFPAYRAFRNELASPQPALGGLKRDARSIWDERLAPLGEELDGVDHLVVIPSGAMLGIPVEALVDAGGAFVGDRFTVSYAPSATLFVWLSERPAEERAEGDVLLVGDPPFNTRQLAAMSAATGEAGEAQESSGLVVDLSVLRSALGGDTAALGALPRLAATRQEVSSIADIAPRSTVLIGPDASEQALVGLATTQQLRRFSVVHIATHALVDDDRPERSSLVLSQVDLPDALESVIAGKRVYDGLVTAKEIVQEWTLGSDLVTLSACETGLGKKVAGEGYIGLSHALFQAGSRSLLVSLWKVEDRATSLLMRRFYENYFGWTENADSRQGIQTGTKMSKADALREAKKWLRDYVDRDGSKPFEHPFYWSSFVLIGDPH